MDRHLVKPYLWMLFGSLAFASMGTLAREASALWDWQVIAFIRALIPMLLVAVLAWKRGIPLVFLRPVSLWMRSIAGSISLVGTFYSFTRLPVADVFTITNMYPIWLAILSWPFFGETPPLHVWLSVICGLAGVYLMFPLDRGDWTLLIPLAMSVSSAFAMIGLHKLKGIHTSAVVLHFSAVALFFAILSFFVFERSRPIDVHPDGLHFLQLLGVGLAATVGQLFLTKAFTLGNPAKVAVVGLMQVVFAMLLEAGVTHEVPGWNKLLGVALVMAPTAWVMLRQPAPVEVQDA